MTKFLEFVPEYISYGMKLYVKTDNGLVHVMDYSPFCDYELYPDVEGNTIDHVFSENAVTYYIRDSRLFAVTFDDNRVPHETELTLEVLLSNAEAEEEYDYL